MIGYATIGANDLDRALGFYDAILEPLGGRRLMPMGDRGQMYGGQGNAVIGVCRPFDGKPATAGNGSMFGFPAPSTEAVDKVYAIALASGGSCEGPPNDRGGGFYSAYFRDPEGNKLCVFKMP